MNTIVLLPVKNEAWILDYMLSECSAFADHIIIADQQSEDETRELCKKYPKVRVIENNATGHSNQVRWMLLDEARKIDGENLILCIDADEMISKTTADFLKARAIEADCGPGSVFALPWIQLWKNADSYRTDGVWANNIKAMAFYDDRKMNYSRTVVINDHTSRVPTEGAKPTVTFMDRPLFHLHFLAWKRAEMKQAWYRCSELIGSSKSARYINNKYQVGDNSDKVVFQPIPRGWLLGISFPSGAALESPDELRKKQIYAWFDQYGIGFFEHLDIWNIPEFRELFVQKVGRNPRVTYYPSAIIRLNRLRHWVKGLLRK